MENASEALIMAFAVMVFVLAISVTMAVFSIAKDTADTILYAKDETNFYEYEGTRSTLQLHICILTLFRASSIYNIK